MYRVIIVDDEPLILAGIASMLAWEEYDCQIVGKAGNGQQALALIEQVAPDIVITDIKMPSMDGITCLKEARERGCQASFIMLTNLEEFSMVKEAMNYGACDYQIKLELTEETLLEGITRAKENCDIRKKASDSECMEGMSIMPLEELTQNYFYKLMRDGNDEENEWEIPDKLIEEFKEPVLVLINFNYRFSGFADNAMRVEQKKIVSFAENIIKEIAKGFFDHSCVVRREANSLLLILSVYEIENYEKMIKAMSEKIISVAKDYFEVITSVAVSQKGGSIREFGELLYQSMNAMNNYYYDSQMPILFYSEEFETGKRHNNQFNISFMKKDIYDALKHNNNVKLSSIMGELAALFEEMKPSKLQAVNACSNLYYYISTFFDEEGNTDFPFSVNITEELNRLNNLEDIIKWIVWFSEKLDLILNARKNTRNDKIMLLVQEYVLEHYDKKLTLGQAAEALNISQGYLSSTFKKQYGSSFSEYVAEIKIKKAQELIATHKYLMYEISDMLGFDTQYYFSTVFKRVAGCSPKDYEMTVLSEK